MRKGRSHRKRKTRPSISPKSLAALGSSGKREAAPARTAPAPVAAAPKETREEPREPEVPKTPEVTARKEGPSSDSAVVVARSAEPAAAEAGEGEEESVPPVGDLAVAEKFFSEGDLGAHLAANEKEDLDDVLDEIALEKLKRKTAPHVVRRRARFVRIVTWIAGGAAALCVVAIVRTLLTPSAAFDASARAAVVASDPIPTAEPAARVATASEPAPAEPAPASEEPKEKEESAKVEASQTEAPKEEAASEPSPAPAEQASSAVDAVAEKVTARKALERGRLSEAIEAGERSVAADPTDGEAWLILGAAYQERGKMADARRCYMACLKEGKRGPKGECAAMLQ